MTHPIRVGIGGWNFENWRNNFYPKGLSQNKELEYASRKLTSIEINSTYYGSQKPETFAKWRAETPDGFVFAVKGPRFATNRRVLAEAGESVERFFKSGVMELKEKLGPVNWQFAETKKFEAEDFGKFLALLPKTVDGRPIRHALEVRNESFRAPEFYALARAHDAAIVLAGDSKFPLIEEQTAPFTYARIMGTVGDEKLGYSAKAIGSWAKKAGAWAKTGEVFLYVISGFKDRNPAAAQEIISHLGT